MCMQLYLEEATTSASTLLEEFEGSLAGLVSLLGQEFQGLLAGSHLLAADNTTVLILDKILLGESTGSMFSGSMVYLGL